MNKKLCTLFLLSLTQAIFCDILLDSIIDPAQACKQVDQSKKQKKSLAAKSSQLVSFVYNQEPLKDILNDYAAKLQLNIIYPETETITATVTFDAGKKITVSEAWSFVLMILDQAGYTLVIRDNGSHMIISNSKSHQESLPLYIGVNFEQLPDSMQRIRYIYFFNNIAIAKQKTDLQTILNSMLPTAEIKNQLQFDDNTNTMILTTRADVIKGIMQLITILDETGFAQAVDLIKLEHANVKDVVDLFKNILAGGDAAKKPAVSLASGTRAKYFPDNVRVENLDPNNIRQLNTLVVMGKPNDIVEIRKFIKKYLDIPQESGNSFFHVVELQWMQATHMADVLNNIVKGEQSASGQSTSTTPSLSDLSFDPQIKIVAETIKQGNSASASGNVNTTDTPAQPNTVQRGANKVVIACNPRDWQRIQAIIKQLDVPQKQAIIECLVVDLNLNFVKKLGAQIRTRGLIPAIFPKNMQAQAALLDYNVIQPMDDPSYYSLLGDLSDILNPDWPGTNVSSTTLTQPNSSATIPRPQPGSPPNSGAANAGLQGSTVLMLSGGKAETNGVWAFFQMLAQHASSKVFTRPVLLVGNNQTGEVKTTFTKNLAGTVTQGTNPTINYQQVEAPIKIKFTPLISDNNIINLQLDINLITYTTPDDASNGDQLIRQIKTNVSMKNGDVLILGGLTKELVQVSKRSVPFIESIPVFGNLFTSRTKDSAKSQLYALVRCTTVQPRKNGGMSKITQAASNFIVDQLAETENNFGNLKDPITRWFFNSDRDDTASEFLEEKISDLPKNDYGTSQIEFKTAHTGQKILNSQRNPEKMTVGWFSDKETSNSFASQTIKTENGNDIDKLSSLLKNIDNPFAKARTQL